jgi:hypothetical protein
MRGLHIDMDALRQANETSTAIGNGRMNARGDLLGQGGQIEVRREQIAREYHNRNPQGSQQVSLKPAMPDTFETPEQAMNRLTGKATPQAETDMPAGIVSKKNRRLIDKSDD